MSKINFPNESAEYRAARDQLLDAEIKLRAMTENVATMRRALPAGGEVSEDYVFQRLDSDGQPGKVALSGLFEGGKRSLLVYSFMFGPSMENACPSCTSMLSALNGNARHIRQRVNLAIVARSPIERIAQFSKQRNWDQLPLLSSASNRFNIDYFGETKSGAQMPMLNVFVRDGNAVRHFWGSELLYTDINGDPRHVDMMWPLWNAFDLSPEGRGTDWYPSL